jgi:tetratricopeptide (TPR) repeat protein
MRLRLAVCHFFTAKVQMAREKMDEVSLSLVRAASTAGKRVDEMPALHGHLFLLLADMCLAQHKLEASSSPASQEREAPSLAGMMELPALMASEWEENDPTSLFAAVRLLDAYVGAGKSEQWGGLFWLLRGVQYYQTAWSLLKDTATEHRVALRVGNAYNELGEARLGSGELPEAREAFEKGVEAFHAASDPANYALLCCNVAHVVRREGHALTLEECGGTAMRLLHEQRGAYAKAIAWYETALKTKSLRLRCGDIYDAVRLELARSYSSLAQLLSGAAGGGFVSMEVVAEDPSLIPDLLQKAVSICEASANAGGRGIQFALLHAEVCAALGEHLVLQVTGEAKALEEEEPSSPKAPSDSRRKLLRRHALAAHRSFETALRKLTVVGLGGEASEELGCRVCTGWATLTDAVVAGWRYDFKVHFLKSLLGAHAMGLDQGGEKEAASSFVLRRLQALLKGLLKVAEEGHPKELAAFKAMYLKAIKAGQGRAAELLEALARDARAIAAPALE